jgi:hypothetical protein
MPKTDYQSYKGLIRKIKLPRDSHIGNKIHIGNTMYGLYIHDEDNRAWILIRLYPVVMYTLFCLLMWKWQHLNNNIANNIIINSCIT